MKNDNDNDNNVVFGGDVDEVFVSLIISLSFIQEFKNNIIIKLKKELNCS